ncbi:cupin domain-containing protein [Candidatus Mycobacterium methanotrophicum]|uniref:Cupin domain-containing protein n=1 Tax=Candidatus Mycobacterium methanotrophicum TaxID=2943498 RepID=A0ABY4QR15_9MYCO|nr:cupin domain-containing protein [Candidatus Mycobacterium methanotrophicum]UQX13076.1 cupin domain-containing protein [Candidatus Mycobacterium methanotrophicum]
MQQRFSGVDVELSLAWLLQPLSVETFLDEIWSQTHHHVKRGCPGYFDGLLPGPSTVDELLELFRREPSAVRLVKGRDKKGSDNYRLVDGSLDVVAIRREFADGYTIVLDGVEQYVRAVGALARSIEVELNFPIQVNTYITPPAQTGLAAHYDDHDVLIAQVQGSKIWQLYLGADRPPREIQREKDKAVAIAGLPPPTDSRLEAGDVLYVPRGRVHSAETTAEQSIHLTVGIHAPTVLMLAIGALYSQSWRDDRLNARVPPRHLDDAELDATLRALVRETVGTVEDPGAMAGGLGLLADVLVRRGRCPPVGKVADAHALDGQTRVVKYQPLYSRVKAVEDGVALQFAGLSTTAAADHEAALRFISRTTEPFRVSELPGLRAAQQTDLVRTLIVSGFLVRLPD